MICVSAPDKISNDSSAEPQVTTLADLATAGVDTLIVGGVDTNGEFRSKRFHMDAVSRLDMEIAFSDYCLACDVGDKLIVPRPGYTGYFPGADTGLPDITLRVDLSTLRILPWHRGTALAVGDFYNAEGELLSVAPRSVLRNAAAALRSFGLEAYVGVEFEFFVFRTPPEEARAAPVGLPVLSQGPSSSSLRSAIDEPVMRELRLMVNDAGIPVEATRPEAAAGQSEITLRYGAAELAADHAFLYKHFVREIVARQDMTASFIAKYDRSQYGSSGHLHLSLRRTDDGAPVMLTKDGQLSETAMHALGGLLSTLEEFTSFYAPTVNSYRRYQDETGWAGTRVSWGIDNRTCAVRVIQSTPESTRIECRVPGADINPYIAIAAALAGMCDGLESRTVPPPRVEGNAYLRQDLRRLPTDLPTAVALLDSSERARRWLGTEFVDFYAETRHAEAEAHRLALTEWEIGRYL